MLLIGSTISSISSITDPDRWNEVYLAPQAIEYLNNSQDSLTAYNTTIMKRQLDAGIPPGSSEAYATPLNTKDVGKGSPLSEFDSRYTSGLWDDGMHVGAKDEGMRYTGGSGSRPSVDSRYFHGVSAEKAATAAENNPNNSVSSSVSPKLDQMDKRSKGNIGGISLKSSYSAFADDNDHYEDDGDVADVNDEITSHTPHYVHASNIEYDNHTTNINTSGGTAATNIYTTFDFDSVICDASSAVNS